MVDTNELKAIIFDLDDTLILERDYIISGFKIVSENLSLRVGISSRQIFEDLVDLFNENKSDVFNRFLTNCNINNGSLAKECVEIYRGHSPDIALSVEVIKLLNWIKKEGFKIGIITDGRPQGQWNKIKALDIQKYCDHIIVTDELGGIQFRKPCEIPYRRMLEYLNVMPKESVYIGDNPAKDFVSAKKLGMYTIMLKNRENAIYSQDHITFEFNADNDINDLSDIRKIIESRCKFGEKNLPLTTSYEWT